MKDIHELDLPENLYYTMNHEWARLNGETAKIGITDYAQDQLGEIIYVELPELEISINEGDEFGTVESTKAVSELLMPISGKVLSINTELDGSPELVNSDPYGDGWMIEISADDAGKLDHLMKKDAYLEMLKRVD